jgi:type IV secretion system protein VirB10
MDPRAGLAPADLAAATRRAAPEVAGSGGRDSLVTVIGVVGVLALGALAFISMNTSRTAVPARAQVHPASVAPPLPRRPGPAASVAPPAAPGVSLQTVPVPAASPPAAQPFLIVDLGQGPNGSAAPDGGVNVRAPAQPPPQVPGQTADEMFAGRVSSSAADIAHSAALSAPAATIAEGTIIPAVLETAIDTDLSGFDGSALLIPRASRLIGQYRSGLFAGQSRVYVVWSRVIRPDGVSIRLGSPGIDMAGQSGVTGTVDNHDAARYGPTVMLSLLSGAVSALASHSSSSVTISSSQSAQEAASIALQNGVKIAPTIRVAQGEPIQVFVTKDLLFASPATAR